MRIAKLMIVVGLGFLLASFISTGFVYDEAFINAGCFDCYLVNGSGNLWVKVSAAHYPFSLYILDYEDTTLLITEESLGNTSPLFYEENITDFSGIVTLPERDWFGVVITPASQLEVAINIYITQAVPKLEPFILFVLFEILGTSIFVYQRRVTWKNAE